MTIAVKICGVNSKVAMTAAIYGGAALVGLMFSPPSPRFLSLELAAELSAMVPKGTWRVGVFVDADDDTIAKTLKAAPFDMLQFHGDESPERVAEAKARFGLPVIKAIKIATSDDIASAKAFDAVADYLLFDALAPAEDKDALPGGNALKFDWRLLKGTTWNHPWMLSGGLDANNLAQAIETAGALAVDVSSGVETGPGQKDPVLIQSFLEAASQL